MTARPRHTKPDANQAQLMQDLRDAGLCVLDIHNVGGKVLDILVIGYSIPLGREAMVMVEVKPPGLKDDMTVAEYYMTKYHADCCIVASGLEDVLRWFGRV